MKAFYKSVLLFLVCTLPAFPTYANVIDSIKTNEDVIKFLSTNLDSDALIRVNINDFIYQEKALQVTDSFQSKTIRKEYRSNTFFKTDIDGNGKTDLIVEGSYSFIVLDMGNKYVFLPIPVDELIGAVKLPDQSTGLIVWNNMGISDNSRYSKTVSQTDTIVYKYGGLVEYNEHPAYVKVNKIDFWKHPACFGDCTELFMEINKNGTAVYQSATGSRDLDEVRFSSIDSIQLAEILNLVAYIEIKYPKNRYRPAPTETAAAFLNIYFEDGSVTKIWDPGSNRTAGLATLYGKLLALQISRNWQLWPTTNPPLYTYLADCPIIFRECYYQVYFVKDTQAESDRNLQTFINYDTVVNYEREIKSYPQSYLTLFADHHFLFTRPKGLDYKKNILSLGIWNKINDTTFVLNWDGLLTLETAKNREACKKYFDDEDIVTSPGKIDNWTFIYSPWNHVLYRTHNLNQQVIFSEKPGVYTFGR